MVLRHLEGAEYKYWIDKLNEILIKHKVNTNAWKESESSGSSDLADDFARLVDQMFDKNSYIKYMSPEVLYMYSMPLKWFAKLSISHT